jgi:Predicted membrane protein
MGVKKTDNAKNNKRKNKEGRKKKEEVEKEVEEEEEEKKKKKKKRKKKDKIRIRTINTLLRIFLRSVGRKILSTPVEVCGQRGNKEEAKDYRNLYPIKIRNGTCQGVQMVLPPLLPLVTRSV